MNPFSIDPLGDDDLLAQSDKGCPEPPSGRAVPPWMKRDGKWRVFPLARGKAELFPPDPGKPEMSFIDKDYIYGKGFRRPTVVIAPAGGGLTTFHRWVRKRLDLDSIDLEELDFSRVAQIAAPDEQRAKVQSMWLGSLDSNHEKEHDLAEVMDNLLKYGRANKPDELSDSMRAVIMTRIYEVHRSIREIVLGRLRDLVEVRGLSNVRFVVLAHETAPLEESEPFSSFLSVCEVYRLADFALSDIKRMWDGWGSEDVFSSKEVANECIEWTGGQPLLVSLFLGRLFELIGSENEVNDDTFWKTGKWLEQHPPPSVVKHWQCELARLITESSLLRRKVRNYLSGDTREAVTRDELPLFLAGWIGQDEAGNWAMRSRLHAKWAVDPLLAPERYLRSHGGE